MITCCFQYSGFKCCVGMPVGKVHPNNVVLKCGLVVMSGSGFFNTQTHPTCYESQCAPPNLQKCALINHPILIRPGQIKKEFWHQRCKQELRMPLREKNSFSTCALQFVRLRLQFLDSGNGRPFLPVSNGGSLTSLPLGGVLSYRDRWSLDAPVVSKGLAKRQLKFGAWRELSTKGHTKRELGHQAAAPEEESRAVMDCLSWKRMGGGKGHHRQIETPLAVLHLLPLA